MMSSLNVKTHLFFWEEHPAVLLGISSLIGVGIALFSIPLWTALIWFGYVLCLRKWAALCFLPLTASYAFFLFAHLPILGTNLEKTAEVKGYFSISSIKQNKTPFQTNHLYKGILRIQDMALPCSIAVSSKNRPVASCDYLLTGKLTQKGMYNYTLKPKSWEAVPKTWCLAEHRYQAKKQLHRLIHKQLVLPRTAILLSSLLTGDLEDRLLRYEFSRVGLQHILAISGFHFGILIAFLAFLLRFLSNQLQWISMLVLTTSYYLFLGDSPAVQRAWIISTLFLIANLIQRPRSPINLLGVALILELIYDPLVVANLGFQLSFGSCFGILLLYQPIDDRLKGFLPNRSATESYHLPVFSGLIYLLSKSIRSTLSLILAVNITLLPLLFYHFGKFPLLGVVYNLFFPFLISMAMLLLLTALCLFFLSPFLAKPLFSFLDLFTLELLNLVSYPPLALDYSLYWKQVPDGLIPIYLFSLLLVSIHSRLNPNQPQLLT